MVALSWSPDCFVTPTPLGIASFLCNKQSAAVGSVGVDMSKVTVFQTKGLWASQTLQVHTGVEML